MTKICLTLTIMQMLYHEITNSTKVLKDANVAQRHTIQWFYMVLYKDFIQRHKLENKATSIKKIQQVFSSISVNNLGGCEATFLRGGPYTTNTGIGNLRPTLGTHWVTCKDQSCLIPLEIHHQKKYLRVI